MVWSFLCRAIHRWRTGYLQTMFMILLMKFYRQNLIWCNILFGNGLWHFGVPGRKMFVIYSYRLCAQSRHGQKSFTIVNTSQVPSNKRIFFKNLLMWSNDASWFFPWNQQKFHLTWPGMGLLLYSFSSSDKNNIFDKSYALQNCEGGTLTLESYHILKATVFFLFFCQRFCFCPSKRLFVCFSVLWVNIANHFWLKYCI